ncbi:MAG: dATP/dGTP diphosphohydrolase domain-containing protein [Desulfitobacterium sp.]
METASVYKICDNCKYICDNDYCNDYCFIRRIGEDCLNYERWEPAEADQAAKADAGKPKLSLVPPQILHEIAEIRDYGNRKYGDPDNWRTVDIDRYFDALLRHTWAMVEKGIASKDKESGLKHASHAACNLAFILQIMEDAE